MRTLRRLLPLLLLAAGTAGCARARSSTPPATGSATATTGAGVVFAGRNEPLTRVRIAAKASGKPALLWLVTSWCGYCRRLEQETMPDPRVARHVAGYVNFGYDCDVGVGREIADLYGVRGFPTLLTLDRSGNVTGRYEGFDPPESFVRRIPSPAPAHPSYRP